MRFYHYFSASIVSLATIVLYAVYTREQFYPVIKFLVSSKISFVVCTNMAVAVTFLIGRVGKSLFFGKLRDVEIELVIEKSKYTITETCLALTIFRAELDLSVLSLFGLLLFLKTFHWLSNSRIDYLEQLNPVPVKTHVRLIALLLSLMTMDSMLAYHCFSHTIKKGKSVLILFGFEFGLLIISIINLSSRYCLITIDNYLPNGLTSKGLLVMLADLLCDALRFGIYCLFFILVFSNYGLPLHIIRELWMAFYNFQRRLMSFIKYLKLTQNLASRFPDATEHELLACRDCLICREDMAAGKKLPCSHVFHIDCLRMWLQHQQTCPLCRAEIPATGGPAADPAAAAARGEAAAAVVEPNFFMGVDDLEVNINVAPPADQAAAEGAAETGTPNTNQPATPANDNVEPTPTASADNGYISKAARSKAYHSMAADVASSSSRRNYSSGDPPLPAFYVVLAAEVQVMSAAAAANATNKIIRPLRKGAIVFVTEVELATDSGSSQMKWYKVADGFIPCSSGGGGGTNDLLPIDVSKMKGVLSNSSTVYAELLPSPVRAEGSASSSPNCRASVLAAADGSGIMSAIKSPKRISNISSENNMNVGGDFSSFLSDDDDDMDSDEEQELLLLQHRRRPIDDIAHRLGAVSVAAASSPLASDRSTSSAQRDLESFTLLSSKLSRMSTGLSKMSRSVEKYTSLVNSMIVEKAHSINGTINSSMGDINITATDTNPAASFASNSSSAMYGKSGGGGEGDDLSLSLTSVCSPVRNTDTLERGADVHRRENNSNNNNNNDSSSSSSNNTDANTEGAAAMSPLTSSSDDRSPSRTEASSEKETLRQMRLRYLSSSDKKEGDE